jgi:hypothetical protein
MSQVGLINNTHLNSGPHTGTSPGQETAVLASEASASQTVAMAKPSRTHTALVAKSHPNLISTNKGAAWDSIGLVPHIVDH